MNGSTDHQNVCPEAKKWEQCGKCGKRCRDKSALESHEYYQHTPVAERATFDCGICKKTLLAGYHDERKKAHEKTDCRTGVCPLCNNDKVVVLAKHVCSKVKPKVKRRRPVPRSTGNIDEIVGEYLMQVRDGDLSREEWASYSKETDLTVPAWLKRVDKWLRAYEEGKLPENKNSRRAGSGKTGAEKRVITPAMGECLLEQITCFRGPAEKNHKHHENTKKLWHNDRRTILRITDLVGRLILKFEVDLEVERSYAQKSIEEWDKTLYSRVYRWCGENGIVYRTPNATVEEGRKRSKLLSQRCKGTLEELNRVLRENNLTHKDVWNLDETALRFFSLECMTLHWRGAKKVAVDQALDSKFSLSCVVAWFPDGQIDIVVLWNKPKVKGRVTSNLEEGQVRWTNHNGTWFCETRESKNTRKTMYPRVLQHFIEKNEGKVPRVLTDDKAGGHVGTFADNGLLQESPSIFRVQIQGGTTAILQPADTVWANKVLKQILRNKVRLDVLEGHLSGKDTYHKGLTVACRDYIGKVLGETVTHWNGNPKLRAGVKTAFARTVCCDPNLKKSPAPAAKVPRKIHSDESDDLFSGNDSDSDEASNECPRVPLEALAKRLQDCEDNNWPGVYHPFGHRADFGHVCQHCSHRFQTEKDLKDHDTLCWGERPFLLEPTFLAKDHAVLEELGFEVPHKNDPNAPKLGLMFQMQDRFYFIVGHDTACDLTTGAELEPQFWHFQKLRYLLPREHAQSYKNEAKGMLALLQKRKAQQKQRLKEQAESREKLVKARQSAKSKRNYNTVFHFIRQSDFALHHHTRSLFSSGQSEAKRLEHEQLFQRFKAEFERLDVIFQAQRKGKKRSNNSQPGTLPGKKRPRRN